MICIFDIETIPDIELIKDVFNFQGSDLEISELAFNHQFQLTGNRFMPLVFHKIISISSVIANNDGRFLKVGNFAKDVFDLNKEDQLLEEFCNFINRKTPKLVSFNGRSFDLPVIANRSLKYNINFSGYYEDNALNVNKTKWNNYRSRYSEHFHVDMLDILGNYGATRNIGFEHVCKMAGVLGKFDITGSEVYNIIFDSNDIKDSISRVDLYCQSDVLNTYWLFLKYEISRGKLLISDYILYLEIMLENIMSLKTHDIFKNAFKQKIDIEIEKYKK